MEGEPLGTEPPHMERIPVQQFGAPFASKSPHPKPSNGMVLAMLITAAVLVLVGTILLEARGIVERPSSGPYADYDRLIARLTFAGHVLMAVGVVLLVLLGWTVAIMRPDMPDGVRRNVLIATAIIVAAWLVFSMLTLTEISIGP
jgi:hypothetical protein